MKKIHRFLLSELPEIHEVHPLHYYVRIPHIVHHITSVLKLTEGEQCIFFTDGTADVVYTIISLSKKELVVQKEQSFPLHPHPAPVYVAVSIPKGDTLEYIAQKITELGAAALIPLITERTIKKTIRKDRLQAISDEALEQSGGNYRMSIHDPMSLSESLNTFTGHAFFGDPRTTQHYSSPHDSTTPRIIYIGPEGGWTEQEEALLSSQGVRGITLLSHDRILRTDTAAILGCATLLS